LIAKLSAANNFKDSHLDKPEIWSRVEKARLYYIAGFFLTVSPPSIQRVAKHAAENNKIFCMNLSAPFLPQFFKGPMDDASPYWDVIFGNETEAIAYAENHDFGTKDVKEIALKIAALPKVNQSRPRLVVFTQGTESTIVIENGKATEYPITPVADEEICDTNGAGDAFVGGFLSEYVRGSSIDRCVAAGHWLAGVVIRQAGPFYPPGELKFE
jgi:adenosine kinase